MNAKLLIAAGTAALMASTTAMADVRAGSTYVGGQYSWLTYDVSGVDTDLKPTAAVARVGHFVVDHFAIEARAGTGVSDDTVHFGPIDATGEVDHMFGLYGVGYLPLGDAPVSLYGLAGFTRAKATLSSNALNYSESDSDSGFSYGIGIQGHFTPQFSVNLEYTSYLDKSDYDVTSIGLGANFHF